MSMISDLVDELRVYGDKKRTLDSPLPPRGIFNRAANTIEELSAKLKNANMERSSMHYNGGWIPCSERLPEDETRVLTTIKVSGRQAKVRSGSYIHKMFFNDNGDCWYFDDKEVLAWMKLPNAYEESEDKND